VRDKEGLGFGGVKMIAMVGAAALFAAFRV